MLGTAMLEPWDHKVIARAIQVREVLCARGQRLSIIQSTGEETGMRAVDVAGRDGVVPPGFDDRRPAGRLQRALGQAPEDWTASDLAQYIESQQIQILSLMHVGADGWLKSLDFVPQSTFQIEQVLSAGERADGSSLFADTGIRPDLSDILLRPRLETAFLDPFSAQPALAVFCHHLDRGGVLLPESPDSIVHRAQERLARDLGLGLLALGEVEFFLGKRPDESDIYGANDRGYHATEPFVFGAGLRKQAMSILADVGLPVKYGHSEVGYVEATEAEGWIWEQHEIELGLAPLPVAADAVVLTQWVLRNLARRAGMHCNFDPIVRKGHAGSGLHFHLSPVREGRHLAAVGPQEELEPEAQWLIAGLVHLGGALMAFGNRMEESFVRLGQGKEAPGSMTWGRYNRHALVRLPILPLGGQGRPAGPPTIEFRLPDGSVHPHLLLAAIGQALHVGFEMENLG
jgi:glutamine synthetase